MNLFVYGTLRNGTDNPMAQLLHQHARLLGHGNVPGRLFNLGWYPGATYEPGSPHRVWGDVYELTDDTILTRLDAYEGIEQHPGRPTVDDEYARRDVPVQMGETQVQAQMYVFLKATDALPVIPSGNFLRQ